MARTRQGGPDLTGRVAVVTGGSRGLGLAICRVLARHGATVVLGARSASGVADAVATLRADGLDAHGRPCDVAELTQVEELRDEALGHGVLDIWVNCAGVAGTYGPTVGMPPDDFAAVVDTNIVGTFHGSRTALGVLLAQGHGDLVNLYGRGSEGRPVPNQNAYAPSKVWVRAFTRGLRAETRGTGVRVHGFNPGLVLTDMLGRVRVQPGHAERMAGLSVVASLWGQSPDVAARPVLHLVTSDRAEYTDLKPPVLVGRGLRSLSSGRLRRDRRMPVEVTVLGD